MKRYTLAALAVTSLTFVTFVGASSPDTDDEILAKRGKGVVTQGEFSARADRIPEDVRFATLRNNVRIRDLLNHLLLQYQLAADAREAGFDKEKMVIDRMQLAADMELADAWLQHYVEQQPKADFEALAYETYLLERDTMLSPETIDVSHILVSTEEREDDDARALADSIYEQLQESPELFDDLVTRHSEDPSASANKGKFKGVKKGDMVKPFEQAAFALEAGEISSPVKTSYGYHIIRLDAYHEPTEVSFETVKPQLVDREKEKHRQRIRRDYLSSLSALDVEMTEEALREMIRREFGEEVLNQQADQ